MEPNFLEFGIKIDTNTTTWNTVYTPFPERVNFIQVVYNLCVCDFKWKCNVKINIIKMDHPVLFSVCFACLPRGKYYRKYNVYKVNKIPPKTQRK